MAVNDAITQFANQQNAADTEFRNAWNDAPAAGVGQFGGSPFGAIASGLSTAATSPSNGMFGGGRLSGIDPNKPAVINAGVPFGASPVSPSVFGSGRLTSADPNKPAVINAPVPFGGSQTVNTKPLRVGSGTDALPTTPTGPTGTGPIADAITTTSNFSGENPYVSDVTDGGDVGRQGARPERMSIDDTMSAEEQYRRAWQNEANGFYDNKPDVTEKPEVVDNGKAPVAVKPAPAKPVEYGISYNGGTDASDTVATVYDKATGQTVKVFDGNDGAGSNIFSRLGGVGTVNSDQLKQYTGWSAPVDNTGAGA